MDHPETGGIVEVVLVKPYRTIIFDVDDMCLDQLNKFMRLRRVGISVWSKPHQLIFTRIHSEPKVVCECRIKQTYGMREPHLLQHSDLVVLAMTNRCSSPFAHTIDT